MSNRDDLLARLCGLYPGHRAFIAALREVDVSLLTEYCNMGYKDICRAEWCDYRITNTCRFRVEHEKLRAELRARGVVAECSFGKYDEVLKSGVERRENEGSPGQDDHP